MIMKEPQLQTKLLRAYALAVSICGNVLVHVPTISFSTGPLLSYGPIHPSILLSFSCNNDHFYEIPIFAPCNKHVQKTGITDSSFSHLDSKYCNEVRLSLSLLLAQTMHVLI